MMRSESVGQSGLIRLAGSLAFVSGIVAAIGLVFWFARLAFPNGPIGWLNDVCVLIQYALALPIPFALHELFKQYSPRFSLAALIVGMAGLLGVVVLQLVLVVGLVTFAQEGVPVTVAILLVGIWLVITGYLGSSTGQLPGGLVPSLLAVPYFGYPIWAIWLSRALRSQRVG